jgi:hypothetical protein
MDIVLWYALTMALAHWYAPRAERAAGTEIVPPLGAGMALAWAALVGIASLAFAFADMKGLLSGIDGTSLLAFVGGLVCYLCARSGLLHWGWPAYAGRAAAMILTVCFLALPRSPASAVTGNLLLAFFSVGVGCFVGRRATRGFAYVFFTCLMAFDVYAVWYSGVMDTIISKVPPVVPAGFVHLNGSYALGTGDVVFSAIGAMIVLRHCGWRWSLASCVLFVVSMDPRSLLVISGILAPAGSSGYFPLMVTICPITMGALALRRILDRRKPVRA